MMKEYDYLFKLVIIGNSGVGKSSLLLRFADDSFSESYLTTIGVDFRFRTMPIDGKNVKLQIWDTAGQERFRTITNAYYKGADGIVLVYDTTNQGSFEDIDKFWINEVESYAEKNVELLLIGNKCDLKSQKNVVQDAVQVNFPHISSYFHWKKDYVSKKNMLFFEASAKTAESVNTAFISLARKLMTKRDCLSTKQNLPMKRRVDGSSTASVTSNSTSLSSNTRKLHGNTGTSKSCC